MRKTLLFIALMITFQFQSLTARADFPPKLKATLIMAGYGAAGGALIGVAALAFDGKPRGIAQGASLGLYAGLLFAAYIIYSHNNPYQYQEYYDDPYSPYDSGPAPANPAPKGGDDFFGTIQRNQILEKSYESLEKIEEFSGINNNKFQVQVLSYRF